MIFLIPISPQLRRAQSLSRKQESNHPYYCCYSSADKPKQPVSATRRGSRKNSPRVQLLVTDSLSSIWEYQVMVSKPPLDDLPFSPSHLSTLQFVTRLDFALWAIFFTPAHNRFSPSCFLIFLCPSFKVLRDKTAGVTLSPSSLHWDFSSLDKKLWIFPTVCFTYFLFGFLSLSLFIRNYVPVWKTAFGPFI